MDEVRLSSISPRSDVRFIGLFLAQDPVQTAGNTASHTGSVSDQCFVRRQYLEVRPGTQTLWAVQEVFWSFAK